MQAISVRKTGFQRWALVFFLSLLLAAAALVALTARAGGVLPAGRHDVSAPAAVQAQGGEARSITQQARDSRADDAIQGDSATGQDYPLVIEALPDGVVAANGTQQITHGAVP